MLPSSGRGTSAAIPYTNGAFISRSENRAVPIGGICKGDHIHKLEGNNRCWTTDINEIPEGCSFDGLAKNATEYQEAVSVTINGKTNLSALPEVDVNLKEEERIALRDEIAGALNRIWCEVLGVPENTIALDHNFFRMGGHSLSCIRLITRIRQTLSLHVTVEDIFSARTFMNLCNLLTEKKAAIDGSGCAVNNSLAENLNLALPLCEDRSLVEAFFLANPLQQAFIYRYVKQSDEDDTYVMQTVLYYQTEICSELFRAAWLYAQRKYSCLRMRFNWEKDILQIIDKFQTIDFRIADFSDSIDSESQELRLRRLLQFDKRERYHLVQGKLFRIYLIKNKKNSYTSVFSCHHILLDGWSLPLLFEFVHKTYLCLIDGKSIEQEYDEAYGSAQLWLQIHRGDHVEYWRRQVEQIEERCDLNILLNDESRYKVSLASYDRVIERREQTLTVNEPWVKNIRDVFLENGITRHAICQFAWHTVLRAYGGGTHTVVGTVVSGRNLPINGVEDSVGLYINTLPLIANHVEEKTKSIFEAASTIQSKVNEMNSRAAVELTHLSVKGQTKHGLFDSLFNFFHKVPAGNQKERLHFHTCDEIGKLDHPLAVATKEIEDDQYGFTFTIYYAGELFDDSTITDVLHTLHEIFRQIAADPHMPVVNLSYIAPCHQARLDNWNAKNCSFPDDTTLQQLFENEAARVPNKHAVIYESTEITYKELNEGSNRLAMYLRLSISIDPKVQPIVALFMEKSERMILSIMAVWKSGAAYVPIDPSYPEDRINFILEDTSAKIVIADRCHVQKVYKATKRKLELPILAAEDFKLVTADFDAENVAPIAISSNLAYIIYTSGTTGKPKGVLIEQRGVVNLLLSNAKLFGLRETEDEVILTFSNYVFDQFVEAVINTLLNGQTLLVLNDRMRSDSACLYEYISKNRVTYLSGTPSVISMYGFDQFAMHLRRIECCGEDLSQSVFDKIRSTFKGIIINGYGPTEVSMASNKKLYLYPECRKDKSIGRQLPNVTCYVLNEYMKAAPIGAVGELYIGGIGVARGYHNRPDLDHSRFLPNPFQTEEEKGKGRNSRLYKTGDLARWLSDSSGEIEYFGRNDFQIKIRGLRIELGEIETVLTMYPSVKRSVAVVRERGTHKYLVCYYVLEPTDAVLAEGDIRKFMLTKLPDFMIPNRFIPIPKLPVTISGKVDLKSLPHAEFSGNSEHAPPNNEIERVLRATWAQFLGLASDEVGIDDDFFHLGGDSILSLQVVARIQSEMGLKINVKDIFDYRTIRNISQAYNSFVTSQVSPIVENSNQVQEVEKELCKGEVPLLPIQEWFFAKPLAHREHWNQSFAIRTPNLDYEKLEKAIKVLVNYHDAFRLRYRLDGTEFVQYYASSIGYIPFRTLDVKAHSGTSLCDILTEWQSNFDLKNGPTFAFGYLYGYEDGSSRVWAAMHHLIVDAVSWRILIRDLQTTYEGRVLSLRGSSYRQFAQAVKAYAMHEEEKRFWENILSTIDAAPSYISTTSEWATAKAALTSTQTNAILRDCHRAYNTHINELLLTAFGYALQETQISGKGENYVLLEGHGRENIHPSLNVAQTVGWFTTMYPLCLPVIDDFSTGVNKIKHRLRQIRNNGIGYGAVFGYVNTQLPRIIFNYLGQLDRGSSSSGSWAFADFLDTGNNHSPEDANANTSILNVLGICSHGRMTFKISSRLGPLETEKFTSVFQQKLTQVIDHTLAITVAMTNSIPNSIKEPSESGFIPYFEFRYGSRKGPILFLFPPGEAGAESYFSNIIPLLPNANLVAFNNYFLYNSNHLTTFKELSNYYIHFIQKIQPNGPYHFFGWCFGGNLLLETSRELVARRQVVASMVFVDTYFNTLKAISDSGLEAHKDMIKSIYYRCTSTSQDLSDALSKTNRIVLYKAGKGKSGYRNTGEQKLFAYFTKTEANLLDTLVPEERIELHVMEDTHSSWLRNEKTLEMMVETLKGVLSETNEECTY